MLLLLLFFVVVVFVVVVFVLVVIIVVVIIVFVIVVFVAVVVVTVVVVTVVVIVVVVDDTISTIPQFSLFSIDSFWMRALPRVSSLWSTQSANFCKMTY